MPVGTMTGEGYRPTQLTPWLWVGRAADTAHTAWLKEARITHIINCLGPESAPPKAAMDLLVRGRLGYACLDSRDALGFPLFSSRPGDGGAATNWQRVCAVLAAAQKGPGAAFIYCAAGLNRSATLAAAYVAVFGGHPLATVARFLREARPGALSNPSFVTQLLRVVLGLPPDCKPGTATLPTTAALQGARA